MKSYIYNLKNNDNECIICLNKKIKQNFHVKTPYLDRKENYIIYICDNCGHGFAAGNMDHGDRTHPDDLDDCRPATEGRRQFLRYWPTRPHLEGRGESHGSSILSHQAPRLPSWRTS